MTLASKPIRSIRSFVRRESRITPAQTRALEDLWPRYGVDAGDAPLEFTRLFGREAPVILEIGFGNGESLAISAAAHPETNYLGIEVHRPGAGSLLRRLDTERLNNVRVMLGDAKDILADRIPAASLSAVQLFFPDPWPKKRHHKRRIVQPAFLGLVADRLAPGGSLNVATDWENYAEHIETAVHESGRFTCAEKRVHSGDEPLDRPGTKFERRGLRHGHRIRDWRFVRADGEPDRLATREL